MQKVMTMDMPASAYESLTVTNAVKQPTEATRTGKKGILVTVEADSIRYRIDGGDPSATVGHLVLSGGYIYICDPTSRSIEQLRMHRVGGDATVHITFY